MDICSQNGSGNQAYVYVIVGLVFQNHYLCKRIQNQSDFATRKHQYKNEIDMYVNALNNYKSGDYVHRSYPFDNFTSNGINFITTNTCFCSILLAATLLSRKSCWNQKLWHIYQQRCMYSICRCCWNVATNNFKI